MNKKDIKPIRKRVTTLWAGRAWIHAKYLNRASRHKKPLKIYHKEQAMVIQSDELKTSFDRNKIVHDRFKEGVTHKHYGIVWDPNKKTVDKSITN